MAIYDFLGEEFNEDSMFENEATKLWKRNKQDYRMAVIHFAKINKYDPFAF